MASNPRRQQRAHAASSRTETITSTPNISQPHPETHHATLRLRGAHDPSRRTVQWADDVVDNEGMGKKRSKVCCIYHRPKAVDESSDESSSGSSSDESDFEREGRSGKVPSGDGEGKGHKCEGHGHGHGHSHGRGRKRPEDRDEKGKEKRRPSPNAYERVPKPPRPKDGGQAEKSAP